MIQQYWKNANNIFRCPSGKCFSISFESMSGPVDLLFGSLRKHSSKVSLLRVVKREVADPRLSILKGSGRGGSFIV